MTSEPGLDRAPLPPEAERSFSAERAAPMRVRILCIVGLELLIWTSQFLLYEREIFASRAASLSYRGVQLATHVALALYLWKPRSLAGLERAAVATFAASTLAAAAAILVVHEACVVPFTLTMEWGMMVIVLASQLSFRPSLALLGVTLAAGTTATAIRAKWDVDLGDHVVLAGVYALLLSAVRSFDGLRRREFVGRHRLDEANAALRKAEEVRGRLFVNISHDFRTPLALIHAEADLLERDTPPSERSAALARVKGHTSALAELTNELLELARLEAGRTPFSPSRFDVRELADEMASQFRGASALPVVQVLGADEPRGVCADTGHVRRMLTNLVSNAVRQIEGRAGGVRVRLAGAAGRVVIDVEDDGPGVPPDRRAAIFERFASFDAAGSVASGIGLPVARELAAINGGAIDLVDGAECTTFRLTLPAADGPLAAVAHPPSPPPAEVVPPVDDPAGAGRTLLVVEDHPEMRRLLARLLGERFRVVLAADCGGARAELTTASPAAIVCDVMLPDGDGYAVLEHVRSLRRLDGVPLLFVSALGDVEHRAEGLAAGADDYVAKPFSGPELVARVDAACARADARRRALDEQRLDFVAELHDGIAACLARAAILLPEGETEPAAERIEGARLAVSEGLSEVRTILSLLDGGSTTWREAVSELRDELEEIADGFSVPVEFRAESDGTARLLPTASRHTLRRIAREAVTNAVRHAGPRSLRCSVEASGGAVLLRIEDDGVGIRSEKGGRGLGIARRRAERLGGRFSVHGGRQGGTIVEARLPIAVGADGVSETPPRSGAERPRGPGCDDSEPQTREDRLRLRSDAELAVYAPDVSAQRIDRDVEGRG